MDEVMIADVDTDAMAKRGPAQPGADGVDGELVAQLVEQARTAGLQLTGEGGLLQQLTKRVLEAALDGEITDHLGYDKGDPAGKNGGNSRNGVRGKTVLTDVGPVELAVPRDREGSFEPQIVKKRQRRLAGVDEIVLSLYAKGLTTGEISAHFAEIYGASVCKETVSRITDKVREEMNEWASRPLETARSTRRCSSTPWCATRRHVTEWRWKTCTAWPSQRSGEAGGSLIPGTPGRVGAALTTTGRPGTARRVGSG
jgi:putative transposase